MELARRNGAVDEGVHRRTRGACAPYKLRRADLSRRSRTKAGGFVAGGATKISLPMEMAG